MLLLLAAVAQPLAVKQRSGSITTIMDTYGHLTLSADPDLAAMFDARPRAQDERRIAPPNPARRGRMKALLTMQNAGR